MTYPDRKLEGRRITIVGAGIAGLALARALALRGAGVTLLEQSEALGDVGAGLQISPNGAQVLVALGLAPALEAASVRAEAVELIDGASGRRVTRLEVGRLRPDQGWHFLHRADLVSLLAEGARGAGVELRLLQKIDRLDLSGPKPVLHMTTGSTHVADLVIGADGLKSPVRAALNGADRPFFTGQVAWRALVPCAPGDPALAEVHMGPGRHLVSYPLRGGTLRNIVAVEERSTWVGEGWSLRDDPAALRAAFAGFSPRVRAWLEEVRDPGLWGLFRHPVAPCWYALQPKGGAALLGDAAHPTLPFLAQGANMALEDALVLTACLARHADLSQALAAYQAARAARVTRIVDAATRNARAYHLSGLPRHLAHGIMRLGGRIAPGLALSRFDWIYDYDASRV